ncbi:MAG: bifunctional homocysteine S-methyltransferase/methylenetetrahydrofolate reductase [Candidatus Omnitrophica bacterium]|nr:bifunctional homocysteine S-methyltransferase/methylenetetrahydrofolate reductase [Candidatus Omnitrophota bacterium]MDD5574376.1 bifunctional homocysteine S-methyltransferase/methylenetetrahydrofolate reductase [Candidatus Omnitrophota bacterium]
MKTRDFKETLKTSVLVCDGALGTVFYERGLSAGSPCEYLNVTRPDAVLALHREYIDAGCDIIQTNTFGANKIRLSAYGLQNEAEAVSRAGAMIAREAAGNRDIFVAGSIGPLGRFPAEQGLSEEEARAVFEEQILALSGAGVDLFVLETFRSLKELRLALDICRSVSSLPVVCQMSFQENMGTALGEDMRQVVRELETGGADVIGANCGLGPAHILEAARRLVSLSSGFISAQPNAGYPQAVDGRTYYLTTPDYFARYALALKEAGVNIIGGCCGITPAHIRLAARAVKGAAPARRSAEVFSFPADAGKRPSSVADQFVPGRFTIIAELLPPKNADIQKMEAAAELLKAGGAAVLSVPENPLGQSRMSAIVAAACVKNRTGLEAVFHFTCRDRNLVGIQSDLLGAHALGLTCLLAVTGDPAGLGPHGKATSVYDLNVIQLITLVENMNRHMGLDMCVGAAFNPHAKNLDAQVAYLRRKVDAGARFIMTQPFFKASGILEIHDRIKSMGVPVFYGVLPLVSSKNAEFLHNEVPGISIPVEIRRRMRIDDKEKAVREGEAIAMEIIESVRGRVDGIYLVSPFGHYDVSARIIKTLSVRRDAVGPSGQKGGVS